MKVDLQGLAKQLEALSHNHNLSPQEQGVCWVASEVALELDRIEKEPKRNCDRFSEGDGLTDAVAALNAYASEEDDKPVRIWNECDWRRLLDWLFAPAEGVGHG